MSNFKINLNRVDIEHVYGSGVFLAFTLSNQDGTLLTAPTDIKLTIKNEDVVILTVNKDNGVTITQNGNNVDIVIKINNTDSEDLTVGVTYEYKIEQKIDNVWYALFIGSVDVLEGF